ncbi:MAG: shikimate dehydrogenase [Methylacidiphilales bacterium]|nr:shikimate dehydrogenase [Candidatus Methylacidiphilales bacterium]
MVRLAVIGNPISHSASPTIHLQFAKQFDLQISYEKIYSPLEDFEKTVEEFFNSGGYGMNVTIPFKHRAFQMVDHVEDAYAEMSQAVNTIYKKENKLWGYNTDGHGFVDDLLDNCKVTLKDKDVFIIGAGGASVGIIPALISAKISKISIWNRTIQKAEIVAKRFDPWVSVSALDQISSHHIVICALSRSVDNNFLQPFLNSDLICYDLNYHSDQTETSFLQLARQQNITKCFDGKGMLIQQAAHAFSIWFKQYPDLRNITLL